MPAINRLAWLEDQPYVTRQNFIKYSQRRVHFSDFFGSSCRCRLHPVTASSAACFSSSMSLTLL